METEVKRMEIVPEAMGYDPEYIAERMEEEVENCIPSSDMGIKGVRFVIEKGIVTEVLADIIPLSGGLAFVSLSKECSKIEGFLPKLSEEIKAMAFMCGG